MKKLSSLFFYCTLLLSTLIVFSLNSCSKENGDEDEKKDTETITLSAEKDQYAPYELVTISASENLFTAKSFSAKINNLEVILGADENSASFILPNLANGTYDVNFTLNEKNYIVPITVAAASNILGADQYFTEVKSAITENISDLNTQIASLEQNSTSPEEYENLKNDVVKYTNLLNDYTSSYNNLSADEKLEFAKTMAANKDIFDRYESLTETSLSSTATLKKAQSIQDYEAEVEAATNAFYESVDEMADLIPKIVGFAIVAKTPIHPFINAGAILATGILVAKFMINVDKTVTAAINLTDKSLKPFEFIGQSSEIEFSTGVETVSDFQAKYRSLINTDSNNSGTLITNIVQKCQYLKDKYNGFVSELPSIFRPSYIMASLKNTYKSTKRSIFNQYVSITNISNPNVTLEQVNQPDGSIKLIATTNSDKDQTFTYDVNYTNDKFASGLNKTFSAKVLAVVDSIPIYTASAIGKYTVNGPPNVGNGPASELYCELKADGNATYTIYNDPSWPDGYSWNTGWYVTKVNDKFYILTGWTNPGYLQSEAQPLKYPVSNFVYRHSYTK